MTNVKVFLHPPEFSTVRYQLAGPVPWKNITFCIQNGFSSRGVLVLLMFSRRPSATPVKTLIIPIAIFCGTWCSLHEPSPQLRVTHVRTNTQVLRGLTTHSNRARSSSRGRGIVTQWDWWRAEVLTRIVARAVLGLLHTTGVLQPYGGLLQRTLLANLLACLRTTDDLFISITMCIYACVIN